MIGKTISHYRIVEKLGAGGMGVVYKAEDTKLDRFVALKFLPRHLSQDEENKKRFIHEAKAASALNHPNIATIYEIDEVDGQMFIAMEYIDGESLQARIARGCLPLDEAVTIVRQIAEGLSKAHSKGIIHRDIKPANLLIAEEDTVKIVDFGLAKLAGRTMLTKEGTILGTVAYMSPEQTQGTEVDHRTDIWSLGVVIYEMLTGEQPFKGDYEQAVMYAIMNEAPQSLTDSIDDLPWGLQQIISKSLDKESANRYQQMKDIAKDLKSLSRERTTESSQKEVVPAIAVLPFANMSADAEQEYFCDGMAEEIINALVKIERLRVAARTSAFAFKDKQEDIREIGRKLNVDKVLEGSVRKAGNRLRITAQLINVEDGYHLWSERYDREMKDVFEIQDGISRAIVDALKVKLVKAEDKPLVKKPTDNLEAYDAYLHGVYCYNVRAESDNDEAIEIFEKATALDSTFALAFAALANAYIEKFFSYQPDKKWEEKAFVALEKALDMDSQLAEAHVAKGLLLWTKSHQFPHKNAIDEFQRAIAIRPNMADAHLELARVVWHIGLLEKGYDATKKAIEIDPGQVKGQFRMAYLEIHRGNFVKALSLLRKIPAASYAESLDALMAMCLFCLGRKEEAAAQLGQADIDVSNDPTFLGTEAILLADLGKEKEAIEKINQAVERGRHLGHFHHIANNIAEAYAIMDKKKQALDWLEETAEDGFPCYPWFEIDPCLENIRKEPRFVKLMEKLRKQWENLVVQ